MNSLVESIASLSPRERDRFVDNLSDDEVRLLDADLSSWSLKDFSTQAWPVLEPETAFKDNWHIDAICDHLEAISAGQIRDLVINIPPGCMKSLTVSVFWPAWEWTRTPHLRWLFSSYAADLSTRDAVKCRRLIQSPWYQERWGHVYTLTSDQNVKTRYENDRTGYRISTSVGGLATGERGDRVCADDPHNVKKGESETDRMGVVTWWSEVMSTRKNDPETSVRVVIMQRVHEQDVTAWCLNHGFEHLCLPMEYDGENRMRTSLKLKDRRKKDGQLLWPERYTKRSVEKLKDELGPYGAASQLQQSPVPRGAGMFKREDFILVGEHQIPKPGTYVRYWDIAATEDGGKYTAGVLMKRADDGNYYVLNVVRGQWKSGNRNARILETAILDGDTYGKRSVTQWFEREPGASGKEVAEYLVRMVRAEGLQGNEEPAPGAKFWRADPLSGAVQSGLIRVQRAAWTGDYLDEMEKASPGARYLDQMDASSGAFNKLSAKPRHDGKGIQPVSIGQTNWTRFDME